MCVKMICFAVRSVGTLCFSVNNILRSYGTLNILLNFFLLFLVPSNHFENFI